MTFFAEFRTVMLISILTVKDRLGSSLVSIAAISLVVVVLQSFLSLGAGLTQAVHSTGSDAVAVILQAGAQSEVNSSVSIEQKRILHESPGLVQQGGKSLLSPELYVVVRHTQQEPDLEVNIPIRGMEQYGVSLRSETTILEGRMFQPGLTEIVVGRGVSQKYHGFEVGKSIRLGPVEWLVVGIFEDGGSVFESEIWADMNVVQNAFRRDAAIQVVRAGLLKEGEVAIVRDFIDKDPRLNLTVDTEKNFYREQSQGLSIFISYLAWPLALLMSIGALAGALNTMYVSVQRRSNEIAILRAIGYRGVSLFACVLTESIILALVAAMVGNIIVIYLFDGYDASTLGGNFTQVVFQMEMTRAIFLEGTIFAVCLGIVGGIPPGLRAARSSLVRLLNQK